MARSFTKRLDAQFKKVLRDNSQYFTCTIDTEDIKIWYVLIKNLPDPYTDGEYIFQLKIPVSVTEPPKTFPCPEIFLVKELMTRLASTFLG